MNKQKQYTMLARLDGREYSNYWEQDDIWWASIDGNIGRIRLPDYDSHDALQRVIDGFDYDTLVEYWIIIKPICGVGFVQMIQATPAQKREAILKTKGLWEEGK